MKLLVENRVALVPGAAGGIGGAIAARLETEGAICARPYLRTRRGPSVASTRRLIDHLLSRNPLALLHREARCKSPGRASALGGTWRRAVPPRE